MMRKIIFILIALIIGTYLFINLGEKQNDRYTSGVTETELKNVSVTQAVTNSDEAAESDSQTNNVGKEMEGTYTFKVKKVKKIKFPSRLDEAYDQLKSAADGGDLRAAHVLSQTLNKCQILPRTNEEREEYLKREAENMIYKDREKVSKMCLNITDEQMSDTLYYAQKAASDDDVSALLSLAYTFDPQFIGKSPDEIQADSELSNLMYENNNIRLDALERAAKNGSLSSLATLGIDHHKNRYLTENNLLHARKYYQAFYLMTGSEGIYRKLEETERYLTHDQIVESNLMAENLIDNWGKLNSIYK